MREHQPGAIARGGAGALLAALCAGCAPTIAVQVRARSSKSTETSTSQYERILAEKGTRVFRVRAGKALPGVRAALFDLGMRMESQDLDLGYLSFAAPAPAPLNMRGVEARWRRPTCR